jgi:hypothetical protein
MKRWLIAIGVVLVLAGGYLAAVEFSGGAFFAFGLPLGGDRGIVRRMSMSFLEDIQFKDFIGAARYHSPDKQAAVDIPFIIQRLFGVRPEVLDIMEREVVYSELDSTGNRARVKVRVKVKDLMQLNVRDQEIILYYEREKPGAPWYMKLEDSLRSLSAQPGKKS